jgi:thiol:disulfide interchange protein DsbD
MRVTVLAFFVLIVGTASLSAQRYHPVNWSFDTEKISDKEYKLIFKAKIDPGWYIYSQHLEGDTGPIPTGFFFDPSPDYTLRGKPVEKGTRKEMFDPIFEMKVIKLSERAVFTQTVQFSGNPEEVKGFLEFMTCNNETCLPPREVPFHFTF